MNVVLLSGGSGKRLWPLSNEMQSKQFLKLLKNDDDVYESMVQRVVRQLTSVHKKANLFVSCNMSQEDIVKRQLGAIETILEPSRRNTFPAIALAAAYLHFEKNLDREQVFVVCPIDVFAESEYFELLKNTAELVGSNQHNIGLMGALPSYPSAKYGYILRSGGVVSGFVEKPPESKAAELIAGGALWNCGVFALKIGYVLDIVKKYIYSDSFESVFEQYGELPKISFDYEVVEKEASIGAVTYGGIWKDLGTWNTLTEEMNDSNVGSVLVSENCKDTHVLNMLNTPVIVQDINDAVIVASHDGILVSSKQGSSFMKPLAEQISQRPMYEQRRWGDYRVLDYKQNAGNSSLVKRIRIDAGQTMTRKSCGSRSEVWVVVSGKGILTVDAVDSVVSTGSMAEIPQNAEYSFLAATELELIEIQFGAGALEEEEAVL
ncbi:MAG: mannose-1-phosphate guanylyltransferase [Oscillospiraceae bacterium]|jgi:mannose-1-phosphate guanylyltransferase|nr:mannose-1-phosphate guanylyltransferase [Oscillospiraceae bacterium]